MVTNDQRRADARAATTIVTEFVESLLPQLRWFERITLFDHLAELGELGIRRLAEKPGAGPGLLAHSGLLSGSAAAQARRERQRRRRAKSQLVLIEGGAGRDD